LKNDKELMNEYWTALSMAHECNIEKTEDKGKIFTVIKY